MGSPVVTAFNNNLLLGTSLSASSLFTATDPDNDPITFYQVLDANSSTTSGFFQLNGTALASNTWHLIAAADLANLLFFAGTTIQSDTFSVRAFDGSSWSSVATAAVFSVRPNTTKPIGDVLDFTVVGNERVRFADFISASDSDGYPIERYRLRDRTAFGTSGYFELKGVAQQQGTWFVVHAKDLDTLYYYAGTFQQREVIDIRVYDGAQWSDRDYGFARTQHNANRPVVLYSEHVFEANIVSSITTLFNWTDEDNNTIKTFRFYDRDSAANSGYISINGIKQNAFEWIDVDAANIGSVNWVSAVDDRSEQFMVQVYDGRYRSVVMPIQVETVKKPGLGNSPGALLNGGITVLREAQTTLVATAFQQVGGGGANFTSYQVLDINSDPRSGNLVLDGQILNSGSVYTFTPQQFSRLQFMGGTFEQRSLDDVIVRGFNSLYTPWAVTTYRTEPEYDTGIYSGSNWTQFLPRNGTQPLQITYSFMQAWPTYDTGDATGTNFSRYSNAQRTAARTAMERLERLLDIDFVEVSDSLPNAFGDVGGLIRFGNLTFGDGLYYGYSYSPAAPNGTNHEIGDIWTNLAYTSSSDVAPGTPAFVEMMRQVAAAIGLKGPGGLPGLPAATANYSYTLEVTMGGGTSFLFAPGGRQPENYGLYDVAALQNIYGSNRTYANGNNLYDYVGYWNQNPLMFDTLWDTGGVDMIDFGGVAFNNRIDLRPGSVNSVANGSNNLIITFGTVIENLRTGSGDDFLYGNIAVNTLNGGDGNDFITSGPGADFLFGEGGDDIYEWLAGDGSDTFNENGGAGVDELRLGFVPGMTVKEDFNELRFRLSGNDLLIDLRVDGTSEAELRIVNQMWGSNRIETLNFVGTRVDLSSITGQLDPGGAVGNFAIGTTQTAFGFLATQI